MAKSDLHVSEMRVLDRPPLVRATRQFLFEIFVTPGFSALSLAAFAETFGAIQKVSPDLTILVSVLSRTGGQVRSSSGLSVQTEPLGDMGSSTRSRARDKLTILCTGPDLSKVDEATIVCLARAKARDGGYLCVVGGAIGVLANNNMIMVGTDHWDRLLPIAESHPSKSFSNAIFRKWRNVYTCGGEAASMDFALHWIGAVLGQPTADQISNLLLLPYQRSGEQTQPCNAIDRFKGVPPKLSKVIQIMYDNIEEPLSIGEISKRINLSTRQVERLFGKHLRNSPIAFYRDIQLDRSLRLLRQTDLPITEVALISGFGSHSAFSKNFRRKFGTNPAAVRATGGTTTHQAYQR